MPFLNNYWRKLPLQYHIRCIISLNMALKQESTFRQLNRPSLFISCFPSPICITFYHKLFYIVNALFHDRRRCDGKCIKTGDVTVRQYQLFKLPKLTLALKSHTSLQTLLHLVDIFIKCGTKRNWPVTCLKHNLWAWPLRWQRHDFVHAYRLQHSLLTNRRFHVCVQKVPHNPDKWV